MESMGKKRSRPRRSFTPEFKAEIVELCQRGDRSVGQVAKGFDLTETAVREWVKQAERDAGTRVDGGLTTAEREELERQLAVAQERESRANKRLAFDREQLTAATTQFDGAVQGLRKAKDEAAANKRKLRREKRATSKPATMRKGSGADSMSLHSIVVGGADVPSPKSLK